ncbi:MAG: PIN domain-containing protein [Clostridia bacterium]|nr:PIN domain-containing protein [Clostridia bacterium]
MRLLIDANIILDVLQKREPHHVDSAKVWKLCETGKAEGFVSVLSFADIVYIMRKELTPDSIEDVMKIMSLIFQFADVRESDLRDAVGMKWDDYEDALQAVTAARIEADYIITRNVKDFKLSKVMALMPNEFLTRI